MATDASADDVIAETRRLRVELGDVVGRLDEFTAELLAEVAARHRTPTSTKDDPDE